MSTNDSYRDSLIESLQDPDYASLYLESHLEGDEYGFDSELFALALNQTLEALGSQKLSPEQMQIQAQALGKILEKPAPEALNQLNAWLKALGLKFTVAVASDPLAINPPKSPVSLEVLA